MPPQQPPLTQPPDPNPRRPKLQSFEGAIDCHIHLFGPASRYSFDPGSRYVSEDALPETNIALQDTLGLSGAVVVSGGGYGPNPNHLIDVLERFPDRFRGVALLPEDTSTAEISRLDRLGVRGARFVSPGHRGNLPRLSPRLAEKITEFGWHVQFYPSANDLIEYAPALLALPCPIVLDHFACIPADQSVTSGAGTGSAAAETSSRGPARDAAQLHHPAFQQLLRLLDTGRVWVKLSGPMRCTAEDFPYSSVAPMARALVAHAPQRLLWGSDWPHVNMNGRQMPNDGDLFDLLGAWVDDRETLRRILVDNPREVYGTFGARAPSRGLSRNP